MSTTEAYTRKQWFLAVNASALLGWLAVAWPVVVDTRLLIPVAIVGLPIAFVTCRVIVAPILYRVMRQPISWFRAVAWGAAISSLLATLSIALGRFAGWRKSVNPNSWSQLGGGDYIREIDGILTPYGWWRLAVATATFILSGIAIALLLRGFLGPGRSAHGQQKDT